MAVENTTDIQGLDPTRPNGSDPKAEGDDHLRLLKNVLQHCFAGFDGEVLLAASEAQGATTNNYVVTVTPGPAAYAAKTVIIFQATHANTGPSTIRLNDLSAVSILNPEGSNIRANAITNGCMVMVICDGANFRLMAGNSQAIYDYVDQVQFQSALPGQASQGGKFLATNGTTAAWKAALPVYGAAPGANEGPVYVTGTGVMEWFGSAYAQKYSKATIGLGNVDNTSDANKPISTATQTALNTKANLSGASFTGQITAPAIVSTGDVRAGSGNGILGSNGDVAGSAWGGSLANWIATNVTANINNKVPIRAGFGGSGYVINNSGNLVAISWDGTGLSCSVDNTGMGRVWTTSNFDPNSKQAAGSYAFSENATITLRWDSSGGRVRMVVNGIDRGYIEVL